MIVMVGLRNSSLLSDLSAFLRNPVIRIMPSEEVAALQIQLQDLQKKYDDLQLENKRLTSLYGQEVNRCLVLEDFCRSKGLSWR